MFLDPVSAYSSQTQKQTASDFSHDSLPSSITAPAAPPNKRKASTEIPTVAESVTAKKHVAFVGTETADNDTHHGIRGNTSGERSRSHEVENSGQAAQQLGLRMGTLTTMTLFLSQIIELRNR